jgi:hypothetical protein
VIPLAPGSSPVVSAVAPTTPVAAVRQATHLSIVPAIAAALSVALLLGLGARRELRWRRRALRVGR